MSGSEKDFSRREREILDIVFSLGEAKSSEEGSIIESHPVACRMKKEIYFTLLKIVQKYKKYTRKSKNFPSLIHRHFCLTLHEKTECVTVHTNVMCLITIH